MTEIATNQVLEDGEASLEHHGVQGMKWGIWNAETRARYVGVPRRAGKALQKKLSSASESVAKGAKAVKAKTGEKVAVRKQAKAEKKAEKEELARQRKDLGMTRAKYNELREQTLKSHDPRIVERGMQTLTDKELDAKIERLKKEETVSRMAADQATRRHQENRARNEAIQSNPLYKIGKDVLYKKIGLSGKGGKDKKSKKDKPEQLEESNGSGDVKQGKNKQKNKNSQDTASTSSTTTQREPQPYSGKGYKEQVRKAVKSSAFNSTINSSESRSAAVRGEKRITDGMLKAEIISVETISDQRKALPAGRG